MIEDLPDLAPIAAPLVTLAIGYLTGSLVYRRVKAAFDKMVDLLTTIRDAIGAGAAGVCMGRNAFQRDDPGRFIGAICRVVHEGISPADALERVILAEDPETVAAFICEPVVGAAGGALVPVDDFWPRAREICSRYGVLLIADEVMSGFGRTGKKFAVEHWGVEPDILVGGKGLSGGYAPIGGVYASEAVVAPLAAERQDLMFYTNSGHPASCAVADKVLEIMEREDLVARSERMGALLRQRLDSLADHPNVAEIRGLGLMLGVEFVKDRRTMERFPAEAKFAARLQGAALRHGVFLYAAGSGPVRDAALFGPPFTINGEDIDLIVETLTSALEDAVAGAA